MNHVTFVTTNDIKYAQAEQLAKELGFSIDRASLDFQEMQADGETIARHKAEQAYAELKKPVIALDDTWEIPGLGGFPGVYMKDMNGWLRPEDWRRLTSTLEDRRINLIQHSVYQDENGQQYFVTTIEGKLLDKIQGESQKTPHLTITSFDGKHSYAEALAENKDTNILDGFTNTVWHQLADWFATQEK